jgi:hypothetical protein
MKLPPEAIEQLQGIWEEAFHEFLSYEDTERIAYSLIQTYDVLIDLQLKRQHENA